MEWINWQEQQYGTNNNTYCCEVNYYNNTNKQIRYINFYRCTVIYITNTEREKQNKTNNENILLRCIKKNMFYNNSPPLLPCMYLISMHCPCRSMIQCYFLYRVFFIFETIVPIFFALLWIIPSLHPLP